MLGIRTKSRRQSSPIGSKSYAQLEPRQLLAVLTVDLGADTVANDGRISLREAIVAANTNAAYLDAPAGDASGDVIVFAPHLDGKTITVSEGALEINEKLEIRGQDQEVTLALRINAILLTQMFDIDTTQEVVFSNLNFHDFRTGGSLLELKGGGLLRMVDTQVDGFSSSRNPSAISSVDSDLRVYRSTFQANSTGSVFRVTNGTSMFFDSEFTENFTSSSIGNLVFDGGRHFIDNTTFVENRSFAGDYVYWADGRGGAIYVEENTSVTIVDSTFDANEAHYGGAIWNEGTMVVRNSTFSNNIADVISDSTGSYAGEGAAIHNTGSLRIVDSELVANSGSVGSGIYALNGNTRIFRTSFTQNTGHRVGAGLYMSGGESLILESVFDQNIGSSAVEARIGNDPSLPGSLKISNSTISHTVGGAGLESDAFVRIYQGTEITGNERGGIRNRGGMGIHNSVVTGNSGANEGGGIYVGAGGFLNLALSEVSDNSSDINGGGIMASDGGSAKVYRSTITGNRAGEFSSTGTSGIGGGVMVQTTDAERISRVTIVASTIANNLSKISGGGIGIQGIGSRVKLTDVEVTGNRSLVRDGGGVFNSGGYLEARDAAFAENYSRHGGGLFLDAGTTRLFRTMIHDNEARRIGGGIYNRDTLILVETTNESNLASSYPDYFDENTV